MTSQILLLFVLPLSAALILVSFWSISLHREGMRLLVGERDARTVQSAADALKEQLEHRRLAIQWLGHQIEPGDPADKVISQADYLTPAFDQGMSLMTYEGQLVSYSGDRQFWDETADEFAGFIDRIEFVPGEVFMSEPFIYQDPENYLALVIFQEMVQEPIAVGAFSVTQLASETFGGEEGLDPSISVLLTNSDGQELFFIGPHPLESETLNHPGVPEALSGEAGTTYVNVEGVQHVVAYIPVPETDWVLILEEPWDSVASPMLRYTELGPLVLIPVLVFTLTSLWLSAREIIQPLKKLEAMASEIEWGNLSETEDKLNGIQEIQSLHRSLIHLANRVKRSQQNLKDYIGSITEAQEEERRRLARELHDETLQSMIALNQRLQLMKRSATDRTLVTSIAELEQMVADTMSELRRFTRALRPIYLEDLGLVAALKMLVRESAEQSKTQFEIEIRGQETRLTDDIEIAIFRIAQEAINNILRHAQSNHANMELSFTESMIDLKIQDDGIGFEVPASPSNLAPLNHFGLLGIFERADLIGGSCQIESSRESGTTLMVKIPVK